MLSTNCAATCTAPISAIIPIPIHADTDAQRFGNRTMPSQPAATIIAAAEEMDADLLVMGATKHLFDESSWESVSTRVLRDSRLPVLVIPSGPHVEDEES